MKTTKFGKSNLDRNEQKAPKVIPEHDFVWSEKKQIKPKNYRKQGSNERSKKTHLDN